MIITPRILVLMAEEVANRAPDSQLARNAMGNLAVMRDGSMIAWMDFGDGGVHWVDEYDDAELMQP